MLPSLETDSTLQLWGASLFCTESLSPVVHARSEQRPKYRRVTDMVIVSVLNEVARNRQGRPYKGHGLCFAHSGYPLFNRSVCRARSASRVGSWRVAIGQADPSSE